jgi:hypothetical protein
MRRIRMEKFLIDEEGMVWDCPLSFWYVFFNRDSVNNNAKTVYDCDECQWMGNIGKDYVNCRYYDDIVKSGEYDD